MEPLVSIIMPVRNEAKHIKSCFDSIARQCYPREQMEVIIADGMSEDETRTIITGTARELGINLIIVDNPKRIAPTGLNSALRVASGEFIIRVDGHCEIARDYVSNCVSLLQSGKADGVGGPIETIGEGRVAKAIAIAMSSKFGVGGSAFRTISNREMYTDTVAFPGYTRKIIERVGCFDEELVRNQDDEYNFRIRKLGGRILLSPNIRSRYFSRSSFYSLWRQYLQYGYWKVRVFQLHPKQMSPRQFVPFFFVTFLAVGVIASIFFTEFRWALSTAIVIYLTTNLLVSVSKAKTDFISVPLISISYTILHFSYGIGSMMGLIFFLGRWGDKGSASGNPLVGNG